jgi:hypothetical protein
MALAYRPSEPAPRAARNRICSAKEPTLPKSAEWYREVILRNAVE